MSDDENFDYDKFQKHMEHLDEYHDSLNSEFYRLYCEPSSRVPEVGNRVIVAVGLLSMGHPWTREEGVVIEKGDTSYKIRLKRIDYGTHRQTEVWVHQALITDVLKG